MVTIPEIREQYPQYSDMSDEDLARGLHSKFYSDLDFADFSERIGLSPQEPTLAGSFMRGAKSGISQVRTYGESAIGNPEEAAAAGLARQAEIDKMYPPGFDAEKIKAAYNDPERGLLPAAWETAKQAPYAIAEQVPFMSAMAAGAAGATALAPEAATALIGARLIGAGGAFLPSYAAQTGSNIERQAQEQATDGQPVNINMGAAQLAGAGQGAIDVATGGVTAGKALVGKLVGAAEKDLAGAAAERAAASTLAGAAAKGTAKGAAAEIPGEVTQQALERWQAGLPLTDESAQKEYQDTAFQTLVSTAPLGALGGVYDRHVARNRADIAPPEPSDVVPFDVEPSAPPAADVSESQAETQTEPATAPSVSLQDYIGGKIQLDDGAHEIESVTPETITTISPTGEKQVHSTSDWVNHFGVPAFPSDVAPAKSAALSTDLSLPSEPAIDTVAVENPIVSKAETVAASEAPVKPHELYIPQAVALKKYLKEKEKETARKAETKASKQAVIAGVAQKPARAAVTPKPLASVITSMGGIKTGSDAAVKVRDANVNYRGLVHPKGAFNDLSQIPLSELNEKLAPYGENAPADAQGNVDADWLQARLDDEQRGNYMMTPLQREQAQTRKNNDEMYNALGASGFEVDSKTPSDKIAQAIHALNADKEDFGGIGEEVAPTTQDDDFDIPFARGNEKGTDIASVKIAVRDSFGRATQKLLNDGRIKIVQTYKDLPASAKATPDVRGMKAADGTVYIVANKVKPEHAAGLVLHEVGVHVGMREMIGDAQFNEIMDMMATSNDAAVVAAREMVPSDTPAQYRNEEALAYLVQSAPKHNIVRRLIDAVKAWVYKAYGKGVNLSEGVLRELAVGAIKRESKLGRRKGAESLFSRREDVVKTDNPGGEWLETKRKYAEEDYAKGRKVSGPVTGYTSGVVDFPVSEAVKIKGANGENPVAGTPKFDALMESAKKDGFNDADGGILIGVNHRGEPYILEGNNRAAVANAVGKKTLKAEVKYYAGGEQVDGALTPQKLNQLLSPTEQTAAGEQSVITGAEKISDKQLAERKMEQPLRSTKTQKPMDDGLFGEPNTQMAMFSKETTSDAANILSSVRANKDIHPLFAMVGNPWQVAAKSKIVNAIYSTVKGRATYAEHLSHEYVNLQREYREMPWKSRKRIADYAREASGDLEILAKEKAGDFGDLTKEEISALKAMRKSFDLVGPSFVRAYADNVGIKNTKDKTITQIQNELRAIIDKAGVTVMEKTAAKRALNASEVLRFVVPNYWPRIRTGDYWINIADAEGNTVLNDQMQSSTLGNRMMRPLSTSPSKSVEDTLVELAKQYPSSKGYKITHNYVSKMKNPASKGLDTGTIDMIMKAGSKAEGDMEAFYAAMDDVIERLAEVQKPSFMKQSQKIKGLPDQPHDDIIDIYTNMVSHIPARLAYETRWTDSVNAIGKGKPHEQKYANAYVKYINQQNSDILSAIRLWTFYSAFSLRPLTPIANWGSLHTVAAPLMGQYFGTPRAHAMLGRVFNTALKGVKWSKEDGLIFNPEELKVSPALRKAIKNSPNLSNYNARDMQGKEVMATMKGRMTERATTAWERTAKWLSSGMGSSEQMARHQAFIAAYEGFASDPAARKKFIEKHGSDHRYVTAAEDGAGVGSPESMADWVVQSAFFDAGKMNHSPWERGWLGVPTQFKGYGYKLLSTMIGLAKDGGPQGKLTAAILLGSALTLSGMAGAPEVDDIEKLWKLVDPNTDFKTTWRQILQNDMGFSQYAADAVINGAGNLIGVPIGRQFSQSSLLPNNADLSALLGPAASLTYARIQSGNRRAAAGQPLGARADYLGAIPGVGTALRDLTLATSVYPEEGVKTSYGKTVIPAGQVTAAERMKTVFGIGSPRINQEYEQRAAIQNEGKKGEAERDRTTATLADLAIKRDNANARGDRASALDYQKEYQSVMADYQKKMRDPKTPVDEKYQITGTTVRNKMMEMKNPRAAQLKNLNKFQRPEGAKIQKLYEKPY